VKKILAACAGVFGCAAVALVCGVGTASADDGVVGETYGHAKIALSRAGKTPVVAATVGDRAEWDDCLVMSATPASPINAFGKKNKGRPKVKVSLNCYANFSTSLSPGFSLQSPEGQKLYQEALDAYRKKEAEAAEAEG
jgi:hypothetical protein